MTTKTKLDAFMAGTKSLVDADIAKGEELAPILIRRRIDQGVQEHRAQIDAYLREIADVGMNEAAKVE